MLSRLGGSGAIVLTERKKKKQTDKKLSDDVENNTVVAIADSNNAVLFIPGPVAIDCVRGPAIGLQLAGWLSLADATAGGRSESQSCRVQHAAVF